MIVANVIDYITPARHTHHTSAAETTASNIIYKKRQKQFTNVTMWTERKKNEQQ